MQAVSFLLGSQIDSIEVMVTLGPSFAVFLQCLLVLGQGRLSKLKSIRAFLKRLNFGLISRLECLVGLHCLLEVEPVLSGLVMIFLQALRKNEKIQ